MEFIGRANQLTKLDALWRKRTASSGSWSRANTIATHLTP